MRYFFVSFVVMYKYESVSFGVSSRMFHRDSVFSYHTFPSREYLISEIRKETKQDIISIVNIVEFKSADDFYLYIGQPNKEKLEDLRRKRKKPCPYREQYISEGFPMYRCNKGHQHGCNCKDDISDGYLCDWVLEQPDQD